MNEALQTQLSEILELGKQGVLQAADMIKEQMPDLVEQIFRWEFCVSFLLNIFGILIVIICVVWLKSLWKYAKSKDNFNYIMDVEPGSLYGILMWFGISFGIVGFFCLFNLTWFKILIAPKLFLIEYISNLVK